MEPNELIAIQYDRIIGEKETTKVFLFLIDGKNIWLPKSQVEDIRETEKVVVIPFWLAKAKQLETYGE